MSDTSTPLLHRLYDGLRSVVTFDAYAAAVRQATDDLPVIKLEKTDPAVSYRTADGDQSCYGCRHYQWGACSLVEGIVEATAVCDLHRPPVTVMPPSDAEGEAMMAPQLATVASSEAGAWRLFIEQTVTNAPERIPLMPRPGSYTHPAFGKIELAPDRINRFVSNLNNGIYQRQIPVDAEHQTKVSGALGWVTRAEINADGSADAVVEWTDRGRSLMAGDRFRYVSPEWYERWRDPASGQEHSDVLIGLALTTRPFFKDGALRPLVASEGALLADGEDADARAAREESMAEETVTAVTGEETAQRFAELERQMSELVAAKAAAEGRVAEMEAASARRAFTDEVMGRSDANGARWFGEVETHVAILEALPDQLRASYIAQQRRIAAELATSPLLTEVGTAMAPAEGATAWSRIDAKARAYAEEQGTTIEQARAHVILSDRELSRAYAAERGAAAAEG